MSPEIFYTTMVSKISADLQQLTHPLAWGLFRYKNGCTNSIFNGNKVLLFDLNIETKKYSLVRSICLGKK